MIIILTRKDELDRGEKPTPIELLHLTDFNLTAKQIALADIIAFVEPSPHGAYTEWNILKDRYSHARKLDVGKYRLAFFVKELLESDFTL